MIQMLPGEEWTSEKAQQMREQLIAFDNSGQYAARFNEPPEDCEIGRLGMEVTE